MPMSVAALCYPASCQGPSVRWTTKTTASFTAIALLHFNLNVTNWDSTSCECLCYHSAGMPGVSRTGRAIPILQGQWSMAAFSDLPGGQQLPPGIVKSVGKKTRLDHSHCGTGMAVPRRQHDMKELFSQKLRRMIPVIRHNNRSRRVLWCCCCFFNESKWPDCW